MGSGWKCVLEKNLPYGIFPHRLFCCALQNKLLVCLTDFFDEQISVFHAESGEVVHDVKPEGSGTQTLGTFGLVVVFICYRNKQRVDVYTSHLNVIKELLH